MKDRGTTAWGKRTARRTLTVAAVVGALCAAARADVTSDQAAAIVVFPKIVVDVTTPQIQPPAQIDTIIRLSNTSNAPVSVHCFYIDATPQCTSDPTKSCLSTPVTCVPSVQCPIVTSPNSGTCIGCQAQWQESDFFVNITAQQPVAWLASRGAVLCDQGDDSGVPCFPLPGSPNPGPTNNGGSRVNPVPRDPFVGELKCIAVDLNDQPVEANVLKGEAEIVRTSTTLLDVESYNAIGIPANPGTNNGDTTLVLGGGVCNGGTNAGMPCTDASGCPRGRCSAEYTGCPNILILDHFFDGAVDPVSGDTITTHLTLVPCTEDFATQQPLTTSVQFLVFNEFEQRFSTSTPVTCFKETPIASLDGASPGRSIFSAAVNGTLTGQTRIRGVAVTDPGHGHTLLGVAEEFRARGGTAAFNLHFQGTRPQSDFIYLPQQ